MDKLVPITLNAFQEVLRRRVFYIVLLLALLITLMIGSQLFFLRMAQEAGEREIITTIGADIVQNSLQTWDSAAMFLALFLGAIAISSEISGKTIVHVMSRPVERWIYLLGRWFGVLIFLWLFLAIGIVGALLISLWLGVPITPTLLFAFLEMFVSATFYSGVALGLSVFLPSMLAGILSLLLSLLPLITESSIHDPRWLRRVPALLGYYLGPAKPPARLLTESFNKESLNTTYSVYLYVFVENILYVGAILILAALVFRRRELRVR